MSMIPFLKNKDKQGGGPTIEVERSPDQTNPKHLLEGIAEELIQAITKKDFAAIRASLRAFLLMINEDQGQE